MTKLLAKIETVQTAQLQDMARSLMADTRDGAELVLSTILQVLESRLGEEAFVSFCSELEA